MKIFFVILFFSSTIQCGRPDLDQINTKKHEYYAQISRFHLQTSQKEIPHDSETCSKLEAEVGSIISEIEQDILAYSAHKDLPGIDVNVKKFKVYLNKLKHCAYLLRMHKEFITREFNWDLDFD